MKIYSTQGLELLDIQVDDSSVRYRSIMSDDSLTLKFSHIEPVTVPVGSYVNFEGQRYTLWLPENFKKHNTRNFEYTITLGGWREALKLFKFKDLSAVPYRLKFSLTAKPVEFIQLLVDNMNIHDSGWTVGSCIDAVERTLSFNHEYCFDVLARIAQEWSTEFEIEGKKIHLRKVEKFKDAPLPLSYGKGNGFKSGVGRTNDGDKQPIGRLYVQGGERNIDFSTYGSSSLLLPKDQALVVDGKTYRTDAHGMYITRDGNDLVAEDSFDASHIYPKRVGVVSEVVEVDAEKHFYDIKDASIPASLDYSQCRIDGEKATISFQSGALAGREFDIEQTDKALTGYDHEERLFKIVPQELDGIVMPGGAFVPAVGDQYAIFNISMPESYIADNVTKTGASWDMFRECVTYFAENEKQKFSFTGELDGIWSKSKWLEIGGKIVPGGHVLFTDEQFLPSGEVIRITAIKDYVNFPHKPEITLSNSVVSGGGIGSDLGDLEGEEVVTEELHKKAIRFTKRRWRDTVETMSLLEKALLNFDKGINPIFVQTMQLLVGDESLQFRFVNNKITPSAVDHQVFFNAENKVLTAQTGIIQHMTMGIDTVSPGHDASEYNFWDLPLYQSPPLEAESSYYLYARCSKTTQAASFLLSESSIKMDAEAGYHHLLVGILNSESEGERSFVTLYGFTEILPGRITTDKIVSTDGKTYFDLVQGVIGGRLRFLSNGTEKDLADWADSVLNNLNNTDQTITDLEDYLNEAFRDGLIEEAEAKAIETYINQVQSEKAEVEATYNKLYINPILQGTAKSNLLNAKISFFGAVDNLTSSINAVIADGRVTASEKQSINAIFNTYRTSYAAFSTRIEEAKQFVEQAIKSIADDAKNAADNAQSMSSDALAAANTAKAITDKFGTTIDGGLVQTVMMLLREANSETNTAGISGVQGALQNNPAFWAGGEYEQAMALIVFLSKMSAGTTPDSGEYADLAKITLLHNGAAKIGDFIIEESGRIVMVDPATGKARLVFAPTNIPDISELVSSTNDGGNVNVSFGNISKPFESRDLGGVINVTRDNSTIVFDGSTLNVEASSARAGHATVSAQLTRNGVAYADLGAVSVFFDKDTGAISDRANSRDLGVRIFNFMPQGEYQIRLLLNASVSLLNASGGFTGSKLTWTYTKAGVRYFQFGLDGMMAFFSNNHMHFTETNGLTIGGKTNMPGVLASGTVAASGGQANTWGAKSSTGGTSTVTGGRRVPLLNLAHNNYTVQITPHTSTVPFRVGAKTSTGFEALGTGAFDYTVIGSNY